LIRDLRHNDGQIFATSLAFMEPCDWIRAAHVLGIDVNRPDAHGETFLHVAARHRAHANVYLALVDAGADINARDHGGNTPLMKAVSQPFLQQQLFALHPVKILLACGANASLANADGKTPLHMVTCVHKIASSLVKAHADVNCADNEGHTVLHYLALEGSDPCQNVKKVLDVLLKAGADVGAQNKKGQTPWDLGDEEWKAMLKRAVAHNGVKS